MHPGSPTRCVNRHHGWHRLRSSWAGETTLSKPSPAEPAGVGTGGGQRSRAARAYFFGLSAAGAVDIDEGAVEDGLAGACCSLLDDSEPTR